MHIGKIGIERSYETQLHAPGYEQVEVNADKRVLRSIKRGADAGQQPVPDDRRAVAKVAEDAFAGRAGAAVAIDPRNGEVLAMVSVPNFGPEPVRQRDQPYRLQHAAQRRGPATAESRAIRQLPARLDGEALCRAGRARARRAQARPIVSTGEFHIPGDSKRAYRDDVRWGHGRRPARSNRAVGQYVLLRSRARDGHRPLSSTLAKFGFGARPAST
jgi:penicillin-binding protein 2